MGIIQAPSVGQTIFLSCTIIRASRGMVFGQPLTEILTKSGSLEAIRSHTTQSNLQKNVMTSTTSRPSVRSLYAIFPLPPPLFENNHATQTYSSPPLHSLPPPPHQPHPHNHNPTPSPLIQPSSQQPNTSTSTNPILNSPIYNTLPVPPHKTADPPSLRPLLMSPLPFFPTPPSPTSPPPHRQSTSPPSQNPHQRPLLFHAGFPRKGVELLVRRSFGGKWLGVVVQAVDAGLQWVGSSRIGRDWSRWLSL